MKKLFAILLAMCCLFLSGCGSETPQGSAVQSSPSSASSSASSASGEKATPSAADQAEKLLSSLSLEEKIGQLFFVRCPDSSAVEDVAAYHLGGYILFGKDFKGLTANEIIQTLSAYQRTAAADTGIPLLMGTDEEGGTVVRVSSNPSLCKNRFRSPQQLFADGGMEEVIQETQEKDTLLKALGVNVNFAPVADVSTSAKDFIYARSFGQNASATADYISDVISQTDTDGMGSVLKHFPGYGNNVDTHTGIATDTRPLSTFEASDFLPFQSGIQTADGKTAVLVSHNIMTAVDKTLPSSLSPAVHQLLRQKLNFDGVVMTDDLAMDAVKAYATNGSAAVLALQAGNDMVLSTDYRTEIPLVIAAVQDGTLKEEDINTACLRVLTWKINLGLLKSGKTSN